MLDETTRLILKIEADKPAAQQTAQTLHKHQQDIEHTTRLYNRMAEQGMKLREVGTVFAGLGAAIIAPFALAAREYADRFKGLEATANRYNAALQRQADANSALGRVAASALTPQLEKIAALTEKIAQFAAAHPELVSTGLNLGAVLVAGGGALAAVGQVQATLGRIQAIASGGGLAGGVVNAVVGVAALAVGAKIAEVGLNTFGKATGNAALEHFKLSDALKTARQILGGAALALGQAFVDAKVAWGRLQDIVTGVFALVKDKFEGILDQLATGFRILMIQLQATLVSAYNGIAEKLGLATIEYKHGQTPEDQIRNERLGLSVRGEGRANQLAQTGGQLAQNEAGRQRQKAIDQANLANFARDVARFAETGSLGPNVDKLVNGIVSRIQGVFAGGTPASQRGVSPELVNAYIDRVKKLAASDVQYADERKAAKVKFDDDEKKATQKNEDDKAKINQDYMDSEAKASRDFYVQESRETQNANKQRIRLLKDSSDRLADLAAARDVAGFIQEQRSAKKELDRMAKDASDAEKQRKEDYDKQRKEAADQRDKQLKDLQVQFDHEKRDRKQAYDDQLDALRVKHANEKREIDRAFAEQVAALQGNYAGLQAMHDAYYSQMNSAALNFVNTQKAYLQSLYGGALGLTSGASGGAASAGYVSGSSFSAAQQSTIYNALQNAGLTTPITVNVNNPIGAHEITENATRGALAGVRQAREMSSTMGRSAL